VAGLFEVHTTLELSTADRATRTPPDQWVVGGIAYECQAVAPWLKTVGARDFTVAVLQRVVAS